MLQCWYCCYRWLSCIAAAGDSTAAEAAGSLAAVAASRAAVARAACDKHFLMLSCSPLQLFFQEALVNVSREPLIVLIVFILLLPLLLSGWHCLQSFYCWWSCCWCWGCCWLPGRHLLLFGCCYICGAAVAAARAATAVCLAGDIVAAGIEATQAIIYINRLETTSSNSN